MRISKKSDYALRVLFSLMNYYGNGPVPIRELAKQNSIPKRFLEHILLDLKEQGWVDSVSGKFGGYYLSMHPQEIKMGQVLRYFDGLLAPINCVSINQYERCSQEAVCRFRRLFLQTRNDTARAMDSASLAEVYAGKIVQQREVMDDLVTEGAGI